MSFSFLDVFCFFISIFSRHQTSDSDCSSPVYDTIRLSEEEDIDNIPLADMSLDDVPAVPEETQDRPTTEKRPLEETPGKPMMSKRLPKMSTPK